MTDEKKVKDSVIRLMIGDITDIDIECFVYYAQSDLKLGSGFGGAITMRGGPSVQKELDKLAPIDLCQAVISDSGDMKAKHIIHANGPKFQEENLEEKMKTTILNTLKLADEKGIKKLAFPPMGAGFYGVPLDLSAKLTLETIKGYLGNGSKLEEVVICLLDNRDYKPFQKKLQSLG
ncbi:MAG: O-acetyl-ADP-ribose deacetylase [candidate division Zixibacteria bacterium]|nr:O-acetyl-ADP-ribose deacetylase [candidate division Zixibacteria bacterium]